MLLTVKSREIQRGMSAAMSGDAAEAKKHFLAAAHLELVLADDYEKAGDVELSRRSRISAATCFWQAGEVDSARAIFDTLSAADPTRREAAQMSRRQTTS
jgi:hypothetical protein